MMVMMILMMKIFMIKVSSMWEGSEEPDYDAFARARRVNLYGQVRSRLYQTQESKR